MGNGTSMEASKAIYVSVKGDTQKVSCFRVSLSRVFLRRVRLRLARCSVVNMSDGDASHLIRQLMYQLGNVEVNMLCDVSNGCILTAVKRGHKWVFCK